MKEAPKPPAPTTDEKPRARLSIDLPAAAVLITLIVCMTLAWVLTAGDERAQLVTAIGSIAGVFLAFRRQIVTAESE